MLIVPNIDGDSAAGPDHAPEFLQALSRIWNVVQAQPAYGDVKAGIGEGQ